LSCSTAGRGSIHDCSVGNPTASVGLDDGVVGDFSLLPDQNELCLLKKKQLTGFALQKKSIFDEPFFVDGGIGRDTPLGDERFRRLDNSKKGIIIVVALCDKRVEAIRANGGPS
jgi:hypothetical protein